LQHLVVVCSYNERPIMAKKRFSADIAMVSGASKGQGGAPKEIIMKDYPTTAYATFPTDYDSMGETDEQMNKDVRLGGRARTKY
jgi:hypothetical protein